MTQGPLKSLSVFWMAVALVLLSVSGIRAQSVGQLTGRWVNVVVADGRADKPECHYVAVTTRIYDFVGAADGNVTGTYTRRFERLWIAKMEPSCVMPGQSLVQDYSSGFDQWALAGSSAAPTQLNCLRSILGALATFAEQTTLGLIPSRSLCKLVRIN